jgi:hypothetical protein
MDKPIFSTTNNHTKSGITPPVVNNDDHDQYVGYFQNEHSEQWIFTFDRRSRKGILTGGDVSWKQLPVLGVGGGPTVGTTLSKTEQLWLAACWAAATAFDGSHR